MLNLGKSESQDFDAQVADATIVMIQYIFLILRKRVDKYESIGKLYENTKAETLDTKLHDRLILLLIAIIKIIEELFEDADTDKLFIKLINDERTFEKIKLLILQPKNELQEVA